ncbi:hypothetical protein [Corynebacterium sp. H130]|uniref:hypothetical protein n=1 Tax=Corynebacterium sp. H130 TaxID=3133444 RepID=UPI0030B2030F
MSISRHVDAFLAAGGIEQSDEVVPENECQIFSGQVADSEAELAQAREFVATLLS